MICIILCRAIASHHRRRQFIMAAPLLPSPREYNALCVVCPGEQSLTLYTIDTYVYIRVYKGTPPLLWLPCICSPKIHPKTVLFHHLIFFIQHFPSPTSDHGAAAYQSSIPRLVERRYYDSSLTGPSPPRDANQSSIPRLVERSSVRARYLQPPGYSLSMKSRTLSKPESIVRNRHTIHHTHASARRKEQPSHVESSLALRQVRGNDVCVY